MSWNPNAASFVPNVNARPFVPGQVYVPPVVETEPEPQESWEDTPAEVVEPVAAPPPQEEEAAAPEPTPAEVVAEEKDSSESSDVVAPLAKKFERAKFVDDGTHKEHVNIVFIGHVDAGKSTIGGQLMFLTGMVDKRTLEKYEREAKEKGRESWYLSWCMDTNDEEREKGKTVEVGRAYFETEKKHFTILDAPGHKSFVPNMISGANQADLAVLVISARKGEFETGFDRGGQTREHAMLVKTAGVKHLVILINKMDDPTVKWEEERYLEIQGKLNPYLKQCGFNPKTGVTYIPVSGLTGAFIKERPEDGSGPWYTGPCFIEYLDEHLVGMVRDYNGPVRAIISDKYSDMGTIIMGKMESGVVEKGQSLVIMPNKQAVQVMQIWSDDVEADKAVAGDNIKFKLKGVEEADIQSGFIVCSPDSLCSYGRVFDAEVVVLEHKSIIASGYSCVLHIHNAVEEVKVKDFPQLGRFTLRDEGKTIAIGKVLKLVE